ECLAGSRFLLTDPRLADQVAVIVSHAQAELQPRHDSLQAEAAIPVGADRLATLTELALQFARRALDVANADGHTDKRLPVGIGKPPRDDPGRGKAHGRRLLLVPLDPERARQFATRMVADQKTRPAGWIERVDGTGRFLLWERDRPGGRHAPEGHAGQWLAI